MLPSCFKSTDRLFDDGCLAGIPIGDVRSPGRMVLGRSTGSPQSNPPDLNLGISPSMQSTPEERLLQPRLQLCSLLCALAAAIISLWSLRDPDACVSFTQEQADAPKKCKALEDYADTSTHLLGFCYLNCGDTEVVIYACSMVFGLLLQSLTVLPSHCSCGDQFLRVTWRVDFTGDLAMLEEDLVHKSSGSWIWRRVQAWTGSQQSSLFDWLEGLLQKQEKMLPLHMKVIHQAATFWYLVAALELLLHTASTLELYSGSVSFKCEGPTPESPIEVTAPVQYSLLEVAGQAFTLVLLCASLWLNSRAEWRTCCSCDAQSLRDAFGESRLCRPLICPRSKHPMLSQVYGKELLLVCSPSGERPLTDPDRWGQDSDSLQLQFQDFAEPATLPARRRTSLLVVGGLGIVLLHGASTSCWGCVDGVTLGRSGGLFDVEAQLLLLGSCGRHNGSGIPCVLAACCMAVLLLAQTVILAAAGKRDGLQDDDQMAITLMDFREYQDNLLYGVLADQEVRSHVWLRPEGDAWDFADFLEESTEASRSSWRRSQGVVGGIRVIREPSEDIWRSVHCKGLPTDEGPSTVYIEFQRPGQPDEAVAPLLRQIVPVDFLPGAFVCSLSVGRRQAWNNLSLTLSGAAMALILFDLGFHLEYSLQGTLLKDCEDVLSGRCLELEPRDRINVRSAFGVYLAMLGAACDAVIICILLSLK